MNIFMIILSVYYFYICYTYICYSYVAKEGGRHLRRTWKLIVCDMSLLLGWDIYLNLSLAGFLLISKLWLYQNAKSRVRWDNLWILTCFIVCWFFSDHWYLQKNLTNGLLITVIYMYMNMNMNMDNDSKSIFSYSWFWNDIPTTTIIVNCNI